MTTVPTPADLLRSARSSAVHLEMRDGYAVDREDEEFAAWKAGHRDDPTDPASWWRPWLSLVQDVAARGVQLRRARIVSEPVSEYIRFEYDGTFTNVHAGELVRWLPRRRAADLCLPGTDFWLFDGELVMWNHFDGDGRPQQKEVTTDSAVVKLCSSAFEAVWERGVDHADYRPA
ncbi:DUF6879 family protein [Actinomadura roseirufa]|uniref:DUF6879 family protein n=1 Tax=Actinomadura roseirufa TaxID=2094049 RepID=UPI001040E6A7